MIMVSGFSTSRAEDPSEVSQQTIRELDAYWGRVTKSVKEGDFAGYSATCHPLGVLVSRIKQTSYPLTEALAKWKEGI